MNDSLEHSLLTQMKMKPLEEFQFNIQITSPNDQVIPSLRQRTSCPSCTSQFPSRENSRLWHQFTHIKEYNGFLKKRVRDEDLPQFDFCIPCPHTRCLLKFADFIDAKIHFMISHQSCQLICCGLRFDTYFDTLKHMEQKHMEHNISAVYICNCCDKMWSTRDEYVAHLQGKEHLCPDPVCRRFFADNEETISHFFDAHYRHVEMDARKVLLNYKTFMRYSEKQKERREGAYSCHMCQRRFHDFYKMERHVTYRICAHRMARKTEHFTPSVPCRCGHQFIYCFHQRDLLLKYLPPFQEALEHIERESPFNGIPDSVCQIYRSMITVVSDVTKSLQNEKFSNYRNRRIDGLEHSSVSAEQMSQLLLDVVNYFWRLM